MEKSAEEAQVQEKKSEDRNQETEGEVRDKARLPALPEERSFLTIPLSQRGMPVFIVYLFAILGFLYILNPTSGIIEVIPDNLPFIGNLDEGGAFVALWYGLIEFFEGRRK